MIKHLAENRTIATMHNMPPIASAAVAIIRCRQENDAILLLRRAADPRDPWSGHYSFPGGRKDPEDSNIFTTCQRETREETGIELHPKQLISRLPLEPAGRNFNSPLWVQPFLFNLPTQPRVIVDQQEITHSCWLDVSSFQKQDLHQQVEMLPGRLFPAYPMEDYYVWGFTYRLLRSILAMDSH